MSHGSIVRSDRAWEDPVRTLLTVAARLLESPNLKPSDNFFAVGGDTSLAMRMLLDASGAGLDVTMDDLRHARSFAELAAAARPALPGSGVRPVNGPIPLSSTQEWYLRAGGERRRYWNTSTVVEAAEPLDPDRLEAAVRAVAREHDALRLRFTRRDNGWRAEVTDEPPVEMDRVSIGTLPPAEEERALTELVDAAQRAVHVSSGPLVRVLHIARGDGQPPVIGFVVAHLVSDAYSQAVLVSDVEVAYEQLTRGVEVGLPPRRATLRTWQERLRALAQRPDVDQERAYWLGEELRRPVSPVPVDYPDGRNVHGASDWLKVPLDRSTTQRLYTPGVRAATGGVLNAFVAALGTAYAGWSGQDRMLFWMLVHGRDAEAHGLDLRRTIGCLLHSYPSVLPLPADGPRAMLGAVRNMRAAVPRNGLGYNLLRYIRDEPELALLPQPELVVNYRGRMVASGVGLLSRRLHDLSRWQAIDPEGARPMIIEIDVLVEDGEMVTRWGFSHALHEVASVRRLADAHRDALAAYTETP